MIFLFYGLATIFPAFLLARFPNTGWPGVIVAAGFMGIAIEGVPVPVVYEAMPFTIVWTSLAWHGLGSFGVGVVGMRWVMRQSWTVMVSTLFAIGIFLGIWGGYFWTNSEVEVGFPYAEQLWGGFVVLVLGHLALDALAGHDMPRSPVLEGFGYAMVFVCFLRCGERPSRVAEVFQDRIPWNRYPWMLLIPVAATSGYDLSAGTSWEVNVWFILVLGPLSVALWLGAHWIMLRGRAA